jgi:hypothetical protein
VDVSWNGGGRIHARRAVLEELAFRAALTWRAALASARLGLGLYAVANDEHHVVHDEDDDGDVAR